MFVCFNCIFSNVLFDRFNIKFFVFNNKNIFLAGRSLKFTFPNAAATTILAWGLIKGKNAFKKAGNNIIY
jgi:hypothetical protein